MAVGQAEIPYGTLIERYNLGLRGDDIIKKTNYSSIKRMRKVAKYDLNGNFLEQYESILQAGIDNNLDRMNIGACCRGKSKTCGGFVWKYILEVKE